MRTADATRRRLLLLLTVIGFVVPNTFVVTYFKEHGVSRESATAFFAEWVASTPNRALTADLGITSVAFGLWSLWDSRDNGVRHWWLVPVGTGSVGICFAAPLYLLLREYSR
ncbi:MULTISPECIES: DUF2834 domain-containing protein [unclassified Rhodococcus (in: high G+C Gram-positive bacteria)]|uniref:DUF2834 domain-containing protein n=1 Tax=unclassified Rhodococcus (in: high G+C Gram-positive bacteria) TaxID=192944 RepID=UPI0028D0C9CF|nr:MULTISPECIES: DUF2834 domain-containing protein [unclassified Rhodococcus (in: high G+C Gram-positive bacteria)]MDV7987361.1 DUF2834 domain-containing protein [Rhodococcus sp. IEGM 1374]MDV8020166.1 DUF2834 domain-containing protein [Rhodococcus sp. IEGM 1330]